MNLTPSRKKAIILTARAGQGHLSAAKAFDYWLDQFGYNTQILDVVPTIGEDSYKLLLKSPRAWKAFFDISNEASITKHFIKRFSKLMESRITKVSPVYEDAELVISTYLMIHPTYGKNRVMVLLDPVVHQSYFAKPDNTYYFAYWEKSLKDIKKEKPNLLSKTFLTGPIARPEFYTQGEILSTRSKDYFKNLLNIPTDYKLILVTAGGNWIDKSEKHVEEFLRQFQDEKVIFTFLCGKNNRFKEKMQNKYSSYEKLRFLSWLNAREVAEWMCAADYGIAFTLAQMLVEAGLSRMPLFIFNVISGQEEEYKNISQESGTGKCINGTAKNQVSVLKNIILNEKKNIFTEEDISKWQRYLLSVPEKLKDTLNQLVN